MMIIWYQIKGPIIIFHLKVHAVKLKWVDYDIFWKKNMFFAKKKKKNAFLKLKYIYNFNTYFTH